MQHSLSNKSRRSGVVLLAVAAMFSASGCPKPEPQAPVAKPFVGVSIKIAVPDGLGFPEQWRPVLDEWAAETDGSYTLDSLDLSTPEAVAQAFEKHTLVVFPWTSLGDLTAANRVATVPEGQRGEENLDGLDLFPGLRNQVCTRGKEPTVFPLQAPVLVCYYRDDLLRASRLKPPETWEEYQELLNKLPQWAPGLYAIEPWNEAWRATTFLARAVSSAKHPGYYSLFFEIDTGEPLIAKPGFVRGLEQSLQALEKLSPESLTAGPADCRRAIFEGKAAIALSFETGPEELPLPFSPESNGDAKTPAPSTTSSVQRSEGMQLGFCRLPGSRESYDLGREAWTTNSDRSINRVALTAFGGLASGASRSASPVEIEAAWNALVRCRGEGSWSSVFPKGTSGLCRESQIELREVIWGPQFEGSEPDRYVNAVASGLRDSHVVAELSIMRRADFRKALTQGLTAAMNHESDPAATLNAIAEQWRTITQDIGLDVLRNNYRNSLGLLPKLSKPAKPTENPTGNP